MKFRSLLIALMLWASGAPAVAQDLPPQLAADLTGDSNYSIQNNDPSLFIYFFTLDLPNVAIRRIQAPYGWSYGTSPAGWRSGRRIVSVHFWTDPADGYAIPPGGALTGFMVSSGTRARATVNYTIVSWDFARDDAGLIAVGKISAPAGR